MTERRPISRRSRRLRWTWSFLGAAVFVGLVAGIVLIPSSSEETYRPGENLTGITRTLSADLPEDAPVPDFTEVSAAAGLEFRAFAGSRSSQLPEDMGSGAAWGDFDDDGDEDLFLVSAGGALEAPPESLARSRLYENLGDGTFREVTSFPETRIHGMGAAWGDADGDDRLDLVVTGYRSLLLFRNRGDRFVSEQLLPGADGYWAGASWGDFDGDGDLDLYVCGYVTYVPTKSGEARSSQQYGKSVPFTLNPASFDPHPNLLLRNDGAGHFVDVAQDLGVHNPEGRSLGAVWHDLDADGLLDLYVANDISDNVLFRNTGDGFEDRSHAAWVADYRGAMGLAVGDWDADADDDLFVTHWIAQENALYDSLLTDLRETGDALRFVDVADERGLGQIALSRVGWGTEFVDLDSDGWLDLLVANGSTFETDEDPPALERQEMFLFWSRRGERFHDLAPLNPALSRPAVGRGLAVADYDRDGDLDFVMIDLAEGVRLFRNDIPGGNRLRLRLRGGPGGRGDGARLEARAGDRLLRRSLSFASYLSQSSREIHFGLGEAVRIDELTVHWPGGVTDHLRDLEGGALWELRAGEGSARRIAEVPAAGGDRERLVAFWEAQRAGVRAMKVDGDLPAAIASFRTALGIDPGHEDSLYYLGHCLLLEGDPAGAAAAFEKLVRVNPMSHRGWKQWATLLAARARSMEDLDAAADALERALEINREETGAMVTLAEVEILRGNLEAAERSLEWACRTNPRSVGGFFLRGYLAWKRGDEATARARLGEARTARGSGAAPEGSTSEGDVRGQMHRDASVLSSFWEAWDGGVEDPARAFAPLEARLAATLPAGA